jgi:hypothetical protein
MCSWEGDENDLIDCYDESKEPIEYFQGCPNCEDDKDLLDLEERDA